MKIRMTANGPVVGSDVEEVVDIKDYFGIDPSESDLEKSIDECVADWFSNYFSYGWVEVDEDEETTE